MCFSHFTFLKNMNCKQSFSSHEQFQCVFQTYFLWKMYFSNIALEWFTLFMNIFNVFFQTPFFRKILFTNRALKLFLLFMYRFNVFVQALFIRKTWVKNHGCNLSALWLDRILFWLWHGMLNFKRHATRYRNNTLRNSAFL